MATNANIVQVYLIISIIIMNYWIPDLFGCKMCDFLIFSLISYQFHPSCFHATFVFFLDKQILIMLKFTFGNIYSQIKYLINQTFRESL